MQVNGSHISQTQQLWMQRRQALSGMIGSIQSGDIAAAQKDLAQVRQVNSSLGINPPSADPGNPAARNRIDFTALFSAVQSGDLSAAQDAWSEIEATPSALTQSSGPRPASMAIATQITSLLSSILEAGSGASGEGSETPATGSEAAVMTVPGAAMSNR